MNNETAILGLYSRYKRFLLPLALCFFVGQLAVWPVKILYYRSFGAPAVAELKSLQANAAPAVWMNSKAQKDFDRVVHIGIVLYAFLTLSIAAFLLEIGWRLSWKETALVASLACAAFAAVFIFISIVLIPIKPSENALVTTTCWQTLGDLLGSLAGALLASIVPKQMVQKLERTYAWKGFKRAAV